MTTQPKAEATPRLHDAGDCFIYCKDHPGGMMKAPTPDYAALIVRAVNSYDAMRQALEDVLAEVERAEAIGDPCCISSRTSDKARKALE